jgi:anti-sigma regulatory factor (Ser/Thr protein kinase)
MRLELSKGLACSESSPGEARALLAGFLGDLGWNALIPDAVLLVSELVTNAVVHAPGPIELCASEVDDTLRVEVHDSSPVLPCLRTPNGGGWGLQLVAAMATGWGSSCTDGDGKVTWFELRR